MRYRLMATYEGSPYEAGLGPTENDVILFAACPPPEDLAFEPAVGYWRKQVPISEVQAVWESRPVGTFRGERCLVLDDLGDQLHITYLGHDGVTAGRLGYVEVDRGVFELIVTRSEVTNVTEDRLEVPVPARSAPAEHPAVPRAEPAPPAPSILGPADPVPADLLQADLLQADLLQADLLQADPPPVELAPAPVPVRVLDTRQAASPVPPDEPLAPKTDPASVPATSALRVVPPAEPAAANGKSSGKHTPAARRPDTEPLFADMARLAGIPPESYAVGKEVDGAMCLVESDRGFEVFHFSDGARTEIQVFATEEAACFYLFGVLAAEGVGTGTLAPVPGVKSRTA